MGRSARRRLKAGPASLGPFIAKPNQSEHGSPNRRTDLSPAADDFTERLEILCAIRCAAVSPLSQVIALASDRRKPSPGSNPGPTIFRQPRKGIQKMPGEAPLARKPATPPVYPPEAIKNSLVAVRRLNPALRTRQPLERSPLALLIQGYHLITCPRWI